MHKHNKLETHYKFSTHDLWLRSRLREEPLLWPNQEVIRGDVGYRKWGVRLDWQRDHTMRSSSQRDKVIKQLTWPEQQHWHTSSTNEEVSDGWTSIAIRYSHVEQLMFSHSQSFTNGWTVIATQTARRHVWCGQTSHIQEVREPKYFCHTWVRATICC